MGRGPPGGFMRATMQARAIELHREIYHSAMAETSFYVTIPWNGEVGADFAL